MRQGHASHVTFIAVAAIGFIVLLAEIGLGFALPVMVMEAANDSFLRLHIETVLVFVMCGVSMSVSGYFALLSLID